jgi:hypothetical protein
VDPDPDPRIHASDWWIRILDPDPAIFVIDLQDGSKKLNFNTIFSAYYFLKVHLHHFSKIKSQKESQKESRFFLLFLHDDGRIRSRIRIHTSDWWIWIRIREAQTHVDPVDPDLAPDPEHWLLHASLPSNLVSVPHLNVLFNKCQI